MTLNISKALPKFVEKNYPEQFSFRQKVVAKSLSLSQAIGFDKAQEKWLEIICWLHEITDYNDSNSMKYHKISLLLKIYLPNDHQTLVNILTRQDQGYNAWIFSNIISDAKILVQIEEEIEVPNSGKKCMTHVNIMSHLIDLAKMKETYLQSVNTKQGIIEVERLFQLIDNKIKSMQQIKISELDKIAYGLNIEGGHPYRDLMAKNKNAIWANLIVVLDRPIADNMSFDNVMDIVKNNNYPLLENAIETLNESQFLATFLLTTIYYIVSTGNKSSSIMIHFHQDVIANNLIKIFDDHLKNLLQILTIPHNNVKITYRTDDQTYLHTPKEYDRVDILISFSQCAGLSPVYAPGSILVADTFVPYDVTTNTICFGKKYHATNDIFRSLFEMIKQDYHSIIIDYVNKTYVSHNPNKKHQACPIVAEDFVVTEILQVNDLWNPTNPDELVKLDFSIDQTPNTIETECPEKKSYCFIQ